MVMINHENLAVSMVYGYRPQYVA